MDIAGTKKKIQRATKVAEETYKKMNEMMERMQALQRDMAETSHQVDHIEYELAEQRVLLEAVAKQQGVDIETLLAEADLPEPPESTEATEEGRKDETSRMATSRPSETADGE